VRWIEPTRRNQVRNTSGQELRTAIIKITDRNTRTNSLVCAVKKVYELRTAIFKITEHNYWGWKRELAF
jgi:hypothetical protein